MNILRKLLYLIIIIPVFIILVWSLALPDIFLKNSIEDSVDKYLDPDISTSINGFRKGLFFTVYADSIEFAIGDVPALSIKQIKSKINPFSSLKKQLSFSFNGRIGKGTVNGQFTLPGRGNLTVDRAELDAIPYLAAIGLKGRGLVSSVFSFANNIIDITFQIPDADIRGTAMGINLPINSFHKIQGTVSIKEKIISVKSISLETDKGYARLKGDIKNGFMDLSLELMPSAGKLDSLESMLLAQYQITPGYYVIPVKGPLL
jgi:type II secretion system protein N